MKKYIYLIALIFLSLIQNLYCQAADSVLIKTPFCNNKIDENEDPSYSIIRNVTWEDKDVQRSIEAYMYCGGFFKYDAGWNEKNNYLPNHECLCMAINGDDIFMGSDGDGMYKGSYDTTTSAVSWENAEHFLSDRKVNSMFITSDFWVACTDSGIYRSTNDGEDWDHQYGNKKIKCIIQINESGNDYFYIAGTNGIKKSSNNGSSWYDSFGPSTNTLYFNNNIIYAGALSRLYTSDDNGASWNPFYNTSGFNITSILTNGDNIYIGTEDKGFRFYNGNQWSTINGGFPAYEVDMWHRVNYMLIFNIGGTDWVLAATENGLINDELSSSPNGWDNEEYKVREYSAAKVEVKIKMLYIYMNDLWVTCHGGEMWPGADVIEDELPESEIIKPSKWENFNCHGFAWHYYEGGITGAYINHPMYYHHYISQDYETETNWDYIKATPEDVTNGFWDKVTYEGDHSGIKSYINSDKIISKWSYPGPLVEHSLNNCPYGGTIKYWKSKKVVSGAIDEDNFIGRQIITDESTTISAGEAVDFYVAPMYNHMIKMTDGFHAPASCTFHAYVKDDCTIPWEEEQGSGKISANNYDNEDITDLFRNKTDDKAEIKLIIFPNPSSQMISIIAKVSGNGGQCPINIKFYTFSGEIVKVATVLNGIETGVSVEDMVSGAYLVAARADYVDEQGEAVNLSASEIIVIEK